MAKEQEKWNAFREIEQLRHASLAELNALKGAAMYKLNIAAILAVTCVASSIGALAQNISNSEYNAARKNVVTEHKPAEARGRGNAADTELKARSKPPKQAGHAASVGRAESEYALAKEKCGGMTGAVRDVCAKEAKAALVRAKSDARAQRKSSSDNSTAVDESLEELMEMNYGD